MAWIKDLGNVKGETGNIYVPKIEIQNDVLRLTWEEKTPEEAAATIMEGQDIPVPVYVPERTNNDDDSITFDVLPKVKEKYGNNTFQSKTFDVRGPPGGATTILQIDFFEGDNIQSYFENNNLIPKENTFYVQRTTSSEDPKVYIYNDSKFIKMEGMDLSNYYTKTEVETYVNNKISEVNSQAELALRLLDIDYIIDNEGE